MNRMEAGGETGGERTSGVPGVTGQMSPGAATQGNGQQLTATTPAQNLVGQAGTLVGGVPVQVVQVHRMFFLQHNRFLGCMDQ